MQWLCLSGIFSGLALSTKYIGIITVAANLATILYSQKILLKRPFKMVLLAAFSYCALVLLVFLPWCIRNIYIFHNPVYPLLDNLFQSAGSGLNLQGFLSDAHRVSMSGLVTVKGFYEHLIKPLIPAYQLQGYMGTPPP